MVPIYYILAASIPAVMIAGLYFFDHSVASKMAQQKEFNLKNPPAYHYDILLLGVMVYTILLYWFLFFVTCDPWLYGLCSVAVSLYPDADLWVAWASSF